MPAYNDADDSDAWRDDESMASTDDFSSHAGDMEDSDFEFLSRSSSHAPEEDEETDIDDLASIHTSDDTNSVLTGIHTEDIESVVSSEDALAQGESSADTVLQSTELPRVIRNNLPMDDSTSTITVPSIQRHDTVTPGSETYSVDTPRPQPFNILYAGSQSMKSTVLRKIGQSLMAATLKDNSLDQSTSSVSSSASFATDWSSGCTSVVPITDFDTTATPEVEFVEDSLVKLRVQDINSIRSCTARHFRFSTHLKADQGTRIVSCTHRRPSGRGICLWFERYWIT
jgi:hypothetical protein